MGLRGVRRSVLRHWRHRVPARYAEAHHVAPRDERLQGRVGELRVGTTLPRYLRAIRIGIGKTPTFDLRFQRPPAHSTGRLEIKEKVRSIRKARIDRFSV